MRIGESQPTATNELEKATIQVPESGVEAAEKEKANDEVQPKAEKVDNVFDLKTKLKITTEEYQARVAANEEARKKLIGILGEGNVNLGEAGAEEAMLKKSMEEAQEKIDSLGEVIPEAKKTEAIVDSENLGRESYLGEIIPEAKKTEAIADSESFGKEAAAPAGVIEAQLKEMPENEKKKIEVGLHNIGFFGQKAKSEIFAGVLDFAVKVVGKKGFTGKFIESLSKTYKKDAELAGRNIVNSESAEGKKLTKYSNLGKTASGLLKIATWVGNGPAMGVSSVFARGMETAKEVRLGSEKVVEKTRISDMNAAYEEAMKVHEDAKKSSKDSEPSKIDLQRAYEKNIPKDVLERLSKNYEPGTGSKFLSGLMRKPMEFSAKRLNKQIEAVENNKNLSDTEREARRNKLLDGYSKKLTDLDRMVSQTGELDTIATGLKYAEVAGKAVMAGLMAKTAYEMLQKAWNSMPEILDALGAKSATAGELPTGLSSTKGSVGEMFKELEYEISGKKPEGSGAKMEEWIEGGQKAKDIPGIPYTQQDIEELARGGEKPKDIPGIPYTQEDIDSLSNKGSESGLKQEDIDVLGQRGSAGTPEDIAGKAPEEIKGIPYTQQDIEDLAKSGEKPKADSFTQEDVLKAIEKNPERFELIRQQHEAFSNDIFLDNGKEKLMGGIKNTSLGRARADNIINKLFSEWHMRFVDGAVSEKDYANHLEKMNKQYGGVFDVKKIMSLKK